MKSARHIIAIVAAVVALVLAGPAAHAAVVTATPNDDTYGRRGEATTNFGSDATILVKKTSPASGSTTRKGIIEFGIPTGNFNVSGATLLLDVSLFSGGSTSNSDFFVWGVLDGAGVENFDESTATYNTFAPPFDDSGDGTNNDENVLYDGDPGGNAQPLGTFNVTTGDVGSTVSFSSQALIDWLNTDTNGLATIFLTRSSDDGGLNSGFASKESTSLTGPRLQINITPAPAALPAGLMLMGALGLRRRR